jgi:hypothetical protein
MNEEEIIKIVLDKAYWKNHHEPSSNVMIFVVQREKRPQRSQSATKNAT